MVCDFHFVGDGSYDVGADVASVVECFQAAPDAGPFVLEEFWFGGGGGRGGVHGGVGVDPLFHFDRAGAVV